MAATVPSALADTAETAEEARTRFAVELEFVQALASPSYAHCTCGRARQGGCRFRTSASVFRAPPQARRSRALCVALTVTADCARARDPVASDLAQCGHFKDPHVIAYLAYLRYWKTPPYVHFVRCAWRCGGRYDRDGAHARPRTRTGHSRVRCERRFPIALTMLDLLQDEQIRTALAHDEFVQLLHRQQYFMWRNPPAAAAPPPA